MCVMNTSDEEKEVDATNNYSEMAKGFTGMKNVLTGTSSALSFKIKAKQMIVAKLF
jgi:Cyclo-malto-dextrinase C-terminal domain